MKQRDAMRSLYRSGLRDLATIVPAYAQMEKAGQVVRSSNVRGMSAEDYAKRLYEDGARRGWIRK